MSEESQFSPEQLNLIKGKKWSLKLHLNATHGGRLIHDVEDLGLIRIIETPKVKGRWQKEKVWYVVEGEEQEYDKMGDALQRILDKKAEDD